MTPAPVPVVTLGPKPPRKVALATPSSTTTHSPIGRSPRIISRVFPVGHLDENEIAHRSQRALAVKNLGPQKIAVVARSRSMWPHMGVRAHTASSGSNFSVT